MELYYALIVALGIGGPWLVPGTAASAVLGWFGAFTVIRAARRSHRIYLSFWLAGILAHTAAFYWLFFTIRDFGGFGNVAAGGIFALFVTLSALQFVVFALFWRFLPPFFERACLRAAAAWVLSELISVRIFPWHLGHTQLAFAPLAQIADLGGAMLISFLMIWTADAVSKACSSRRPALAVVPLAALAAALLYGSERVQYFTALGDYPQKQPVAVIQANISLTEKHDMKMFEKNTDRYVALSNTVLGNRNESAIVAPLVIWPESVVVDGIFDRARSTADDRRIPTLSADAPMLFGALTYEDRAHVFNSAVATLGGGAMLVPYHKQILMPFGEYTPFSSTFPWLKAINATAGDFIPGADVSVFDYPMKDASGRFYTLRLSPLICYEDIVPELSRRAVQAGAELLVNLTNDAWFGDTIAPRQHHVIAAFRAIENRRFLVRSTNSGLTAIVTPTGKTASQLAPFSEGSILAEVNLISYKSLYSTSFGDRPWWALLVIAALWIAATRRRPVLKR